MCRVVLDAPYKYRAVEVWRIPRENRQQIQKKLKQNQENCLKLVLMCVDSALAISMQVLWMVNDLAGCL
jgi:hypothetical protein